MWWKRQNPEDYGTGAAAVSRFIRHKEIIPVNQDKPIQGNTNALLQEPGIPVFESATQAELVCDFHASPRAEIICGYLIVLIFCIALFIWSALTPLSTAAIASGVVSVAGYSKTIQHLEGGIIHKINVRDGDFVTQGQVLLELQNVQIKSEHKLLRSQQILEQAREARLNAEVDGADIIPIPSHFLMDGRIHDPIALQAMEAQTTIFNTRKDILDSQLGIIDQRIAQFESQLRGLRGSTRAQKRQLLLIKEELTSAHDHISRGLITRNKLFELEVDEAEVEASLNERYATISSIQQQISELQYKKSELKSERINSATEELRLVREKLVELSHQLPKSEDMLERNTIRAPINGVVTDLRIHTNGGVIAAGQPIMDIVPNSGDLIVNVNVDPKDRDAIQTGQVTEVRFTAFHQRSSRPVMGRVSTISADRLIDTNTNTPYYLTQIELTEDPSAALDGAELYPGMQAEAIIITGNSTLLEYFIRPLMRSFNRAMRED